MLSRLAQRKWEDTFLDKPNVVKWKTWCLSSNSLYGCLLIFFSPKTENTLERKKKNKRRSVERKKTERGGRREISREKTPKEKLKKERKNCNCFLIN